ncbi:UNVERIFIED_CONTAM: hypothetical protein PYX00_007591 [Menopon gallinae]|uniref:Uncharacterized protein n=1 Tax=Menopon gallinae TaxID=328185 RepID=A0AAW2HJY3_9NEOP
MENKEGIQAESSGSGAGIKLQVLASSASVRPSGSGCAVGNLQKANTTEVPKILSRNANGTVVLTSSPNNEAELQLYRVMQRASLLAYYDTLLEMGGDDVQQLCDAGEEEFLEIMALVGMASKPLHVRRLQKALQEWVTSPGLFQTPLSCASPTSPEPFTQASNSRPFSSFPAVPSLPVPVKEVPPALSPGLNQTVVIENSSHRGPSPTPRSQSPGSPLQTAPAVLVQSQIARLAKVAENLLKSLPQFEPKPHNAKKKICKDLEIVMSMSEDDPRRMDEIRKYASIYGRFDCKRNPQKPLTLHELSVNEAAAQICRLCPALLTRRDDLFALARQVVRDSGYNYSKSQASIGQQGRSQFQCSSKADDNPLAKRPKIDSILSLPPSPCDLSETDKARRQERLEQIAEELRILGDKTEELVQAAQQVRQTNDLSAIQNLQQEMETVQNKQTQLLLEQSELLKQPLPMRFYRRNSNRTTASQNDSDKNDTDDNDSQFSLSNASSPSQEVGDSRDSLLRDGESFTNNTANKSPSKNSKQGTDSSSEESVHKDNTDSFYHESRVQVISSSSGGSIIAVANPALSMSSVMELKSQRWIRRSSSHVHEVYPQERLTRTATRRIGGRQGGAAARTPGQ